MLMTTVEFRFLSMISLLVRPPSLTSASEKLRVGALGFSVVEVVPPPPPDVVGRPPFLSMDSASSTDRVMMVAPQITAKAAMTMLDLFRFFLGGLPGGGVCAAFQP